MDTNAADLSLATYYWEQIFSSFYMSPVSPDCRKAGFYYEAGCALPIMHDKGSTLQQFDHYSNISVTMTNCCSR